MDSITDNNNNARLNFQSDQTEGLEQIGIKITVINSIKMSLTGEEMERRKSKKSINLT